jgi:hypothetical protein
LFFVGIDRVIVSVALQRSNPWRISAADSGMEQKSGKKQDAARTPIAAAASSAAASPLHSLPRVLLCLIIEHLSIADHFKLQRVSQTIGAVALSPAAWPVHLHIREHKHVRFSQDKPVFIAALAGRVTALSLGTQFHEDWALLIKNLAPGLSSLQCHEIPPDCMFEVRAADVLYQPAVLDFVLIA